MAVKANTTLSTDITVAAREVDFVTRFNRNWDALRDILGIMRPIRKEPGTKLTSYEASVTLSSGDVAEGDEIPYSDISVSPVTYSDLTIEKYAKGVTIEAVNKYGAEVAVQKTDEAFLNELQSKVMDKFYAFVQTGSLRHRADTWQMGVAMAIGRVRNKFKELHRDITDVVVIANTLDLYKYYGSANITVQSTTGLTYIQNFMGASTFILSSEIPEGVVIAVPADNVVLYYIDPSDAGFKQLGLDYTVQGETNLIGFHANGNYAHAVGESFALMGMVLWAEYLNAIAVEMIGDTTSTSSAEAVGTGDGSKKSFELDYVPISFTSVTVGGTATTAYALTGSKTITFDTAPANNAAVVATYTYASDSGA